MKVFSHYVYCIKKDGIERYINSYDILKDANDILWFIRNGFECRLVDVVYDEVKNGEEN